MSRCLPFSPEAFANRGSNWEALIKLQKEKDEAKAERRREKKLKKKLKKELKEKKSKKERKEEETHKFHADDKTKKLNDEKKNDQRHKSKPYLNAGSPQESVGCKSEQLERSDITEEHDLPSCSGSVSNFLDSVDSSNNKRKRQDDPVITATERRRNVLRIRLPLRKHNESNASAIEEPQSCPAKGSETRVQERTEEHISHVKTETKAVEHGQLNVEPSLELPLSTSERRESKSSKKATLSYKTLIEDWVPELPSCHWLGQNESDDEDWLFGSKSRQHGVEPKKHKAGDEVFCSRSTALWPQAMQLPEVDIFALPYTVPF